MKLRKRLAKKLKQMKGDRTKAEFSKRLGIGQASLNRILQAEQSVSLDLLETICNSLRIDVIDLLADESAPERNRYSRPAVGFMIPGTIPPARS
jgi:transcriptional regulator with XRE-family HTH domain